MPNVERGSPVNLNSGKAWSEADLFDLRHSLARGHSVEETANFLCRHCAEVRTKAVELGLARMTGTPGAHWADCSATNSLPCPVDSVES
jgi:hypothetical protein